MLMNRESAASDGKMLGSYRWKVVLPLIFALYLLAFVDRINISFAMTGLQQSFLVNAGVAGFISGLFFIGYLVGSGPGGTLASRVSPALLITVLGVATGVFSSAQGMAPDITVLVAVRFCLGLAEGATYPVIAMLVANWFPEKERGRAFGVFYLFGPIASICMSPISGYMVEHIKWLGYEGWRWMLVTQGIPIILVSLIFYFLVADNPRTAPARMLGEAERDYLLRETAREEKKEQIVKDSSCLRAIFTGNFACLIIPYLLGGGIGNYGIMMWTPTIIKEASTYGYTAIGFIATIPWICTAFGSYLLGVVADKFIDKKKIILAVLYTVAGIALFSGVYFLKINLWLAIASISVALTAGASASPVFLSLVSSVYPKNMVGGMVGTWNMGAGIGGFIGPFAVGALMTADNKFLGVVFLGICYLAAAVMVTFSKSPKSSDTSVSG